MHSISLGTARLHVYLLAFVLGFTSVAVGQTSRGTVTGLVTDTQKASIANASVDLTNSSTRVRRSTETNESGLYRFDAVEPGTYTLQVKTTGFRSFVAREFERGRRAGGVSGRSSRIGRSAAGD